MNSFDRAVLAWVAVMVAASVILGLCLFGGGL